VEEQSTDPEEIAGYAADLVDFAHAGVALSLFQVARLEDLVDPESLLRDDVVKEPPYWAHLWIGARAIAKALAERGPLDGRRVLDLGCGLGLPGLVAARLGAEVWSVDREAAALEFVRASARRNGFTDVHCVLADFTTTPSLGADFDTILAAELVYESASYAPLAAFLDRHLRANGEIYLTDAFRADAQTFFAELRRRGFSGARERRIEWEDARPHGLFLWRFCRSG
jgi:predicted nicotinamide N-methyase